MTRKYSPLLALAFASSLLAGADVPIESVLGPRYTPPPYDPEAESEASKAAMDKAQAKRERKALKLKVQP